MLRSNIEEVKTLRTQRRLSTPVWQNVRLLRVHCQELSFACALARESDEESQALLKAHNVKAGCVDQLCIMTWGIHEGLELSYRLQPQFPHLMRGTKVMIELNVFQELITQFCRDLTLFGLQFFKSDILWLHSLMNYPVNVNRKHCRPS
jgi:hypothetical protein